MNQRGFATLEVILMVMVIGILASIAMPRFTSVTTAANTAKIQADLTTIDTAIATYYMEYGTYPANIAALVTAKYLQAAPKSPSGYAYIKGTSGEPTDTLIEENDAYGFTTPDTKTGEVQATFAGKTVDNFYIPKKSKSE